MAPLPAAAAGELGERGDVTATGDGVTGLRATVLVDDAFNASVDVRSSIMMRS